MRSWKGSPEAVRLKCGHVITLLQRGCSETSCLTCAPCILSSLLNKKLNPVCCYNTFNNCWLPSLFICSFSFICYFSTFWSLSFSISPSSFFLSFFSFVCFISLSLFPLTVSSPERCDRQVSSSWLLMCYSITFTFRVHFVIPWRRVQPERNFSMDHAYFIEWEE